MPTKNERDRDDGRMTPLPNRCCQRRDKKMLLSAAARRVLDNEARVEARTVASNRDTVTAPIVASSSPERAVSVFCRVRPRIETETWDKVVADPSLRESKGSSSSSSLHPTALSTSESPPSVDIDEAVVALSDERAVAVKTPFNPTKVFSFHGVFPPCASDDDVYQAIGRPALHRALGIVGVARGSSGEDDDEDKKNDAMGHDDHHGGDGASPRHRPSPVNAAVVIYGQTNSGKTFTFDAIVRRVAGDIFVHHHGHQRRHGTDSVAAEEMRRRDESDRWLPTPSSSATSIRLVGVSVGCVQLYNDVVSDLLSGGHPAVVPSKTPGKTPVDGGDLSADEKQGKMTFHMNKKRNAKATIAATTNENSHLHDVSSSSCGKPGWNSLFGAPSRSSFSRGALLHQEGNLNAPAIASGNTTGFNASRNPFNQCSDEDGAAAMIQSSAIPLAVRDDGHGGFTVSGQCFLPADTEADFRSIVQTAMAARQVALTTMNARSSRSHVFLTVKLLLQRQTAHGDEEEGNTTTETATFMQSKLCLVDLAGCERVSRSRVTGARLVEAQCINVSLSALGNVVHSLTNPFPTFVPFRDSKLTKILQEYLGSAHSHTALVLTLGPGRADAAETLSVLKFGQRAMNIAMELRSRSPPVTFMCERPTSAAVIIEGPSSCQRCAAMHAISRDDDLPENGDRTDVLLVGHGSRATPVVASLATLSHRRASDAGVATTTTKTKGDEGGRQQGRGGSSHAVLPLSMVTFLMQRRVELAERIAETAQGDDEPLPPSEESPAVAACRQVDALLGQLAGGLGAARRPRTTKGAALNPSNPSTRSSSESGRKTLPPRGRSSSPSTSARSSRATSSASKDARKNSSKEESAALTSAGASSPATFDVEAGLALLAEQYCHAMDELREKLRVSELARSACASESAAAVANAESKAMVATRHLDAAERRLATAMSDVAGYAKATAVTEERVDVLERDASFLHGRIETLTASLVDAEGEVAQLRDGLCAARQQHDHLLAALRFDMNLPPSVLLTPETISGYVADLVTSRTANASSLEIKLAHMQRRLLEAQHDAEVEVRRAMEHAKSRAETVSQLEMQLDDERAAREADQKRFSDELEARRFELSATSEKNHRLERMMLRSIEWTGDDELISKRRRDDRTTMGDPSALTNNNQSGVAPPSPSDGFPSGQGRSMTTTRMTLSSSAVSTSATATAEANRFGVVHVGDDESHNEAKGRVTGRTRDTSDGFGLAWCEMRGVSVPGSFATSSSAPSSARESLSRMASPSPAVGHHEQPPAAGGAPTDWASSLLNDDNRRSGKSSLPSTWAEKHDKASKLLASMRAAASSANHLVGQ